MPDGYEVFLAHNLRAVELIDIDRGDKLSPVDFVKAVAMLPYIVFPAFRLQEDLRETFGGEAFWQALRKKMNKKVRESKLIKEREEIIKAEDDEKQEEYRRKLEFYEARILEINE
jgi:hypothetical protein